MLQFLVCSDAHTYIDNIPLAINKIDRVDAVLIAGDTEAESGALEDVLGSVPFYAVCGNNDYYLNTDYPEELLIDISDSPSSGRGPSITKVTQLQYDTFPNRFHSLPDFLQKKMPLFLQGKLAGEKRDPNIVHRILMTHGKEYDVPQTGLLSLRADLWDADLVIFGHTHKFADIPDKGGKRRFINPGCLVGDPDSTIKSWANYELCSFAVLRIGYYGEVSVQHMFL